ERGVGWDVEPPTTLFAEATTSEDFELGAFVDVHDDRTVLANGVGAVDPLPDGHRWSFHADAVRDIAIAVGHFHSVEGTADGVPVTIAVAAGEKDDPRQLLALHRAAMHAHAQRFGPFPYAALDVVVVPDLKGGVENPGLIWLGSGQLDATLP